MDLRWAGESLQAADGLGQNPLNCIHVSDSSNYCNIMKHKIKYSIAKGNYSWPKTRHQLLFNCGQGLIKKVILIKGTTEKEVMKKIIFLN